jgi:hypothetical protein
MSLVSSSVSITRYRVQGKLENPILKTIAAGLKKYTISEIDDPTLDKAVGWTSFEKPYQPDFGGSSFVYGNYLVFSLRIDRKTVSAKLVKKHVVIESEKRHKKTVERITIKGENAGLEEAMLALQKGALVAELNLIYRSAEQKWQFTLKGESLNLSSMKTPKIAAPESSEDMEGFILEKIFLYDKILQFIEKLYKTFIRYRLSDHWQNRDVALIKKWRRSYS